MTTQNSKLGTQNSKLETLTILSLEQATTLPFMTLHLVAEGMRVIRVENPNRGDPNRWVGEPALPNAGGDGYEAGMNAYYLPNNLGKEAITLNLALEEGRALLHRLVAELPVDIFTTNQRPRAYRKLGIDYETLNALNPRLIWVGVTGFGPESSEAAYDPIIQARAGLLELTGERDGAPMMFGLPMVDLGAGDHAYGQIMKALYHRAVTGAGSRIDISMYQSTLSWMVSPVMFSYSFDRHLSRNGNTNRFLAPASVYPAGDGYISIAVGNDKQWKMITQLPGFESLAQEMYTHNPGRIDNVDRLNEELAATTRNWPKDKLFAELNAIGVPASTVNRLPDVCADPMLADRLVRARDPRSGVEIAISPPPVIPDYLRRRNMTLPFPPRLGEHNESVFGALGCDTAALWEKGII